MNSTILLTALVFVLIGLVGFVGYYSYRLAKASRQAKETTARFEELVRRQAALESRAACSESPLDMLPSGDGVTKETPVAGPMVRVYEQKAALRGLSEQAVFMRRDTSGEVTVQIADRRPAPLKYILDPRAKQTLSQVAMRATADLGTSWSILADEDGEGRLQITVLP